MKLTEFFDGAGRVISYCPKVALALGSKNAAILLAQLFYWCDKTDDPLGVFKTKEQWREETGLTPKEQDTAVAILQAHGLISCTLRGYEHKKYYLLDLQAAGAFWDDFLTHGAPEKPQRKQTAPQAKPASAPPTKVVITTPQEACSVRAEKPLDNAPQSAPPKVQFARGIGRDEITQQITQETTPPERGRRVVFSFFGLGQSVPFDVHEYLRAELDG